MKKHSKIFDLMIYRREMKKERNLESHSWKHRILSQPVIILKVGLHKVHDKCDFDVRGRVYFIYESTGYLFECIKGGK